MEQIAKQIKVMGGELKQLALYHRKCIEPLWIYWKTIKVGSCFLQGIYKATSNELGGKFLGNLHKVGESHSLQMRVDA